MSAGLLTFLGLVLAAALTAVASWIVGHKTHAERDAGLAKTLADADTGVAIAADTIVASITRDYQRLSAELESVRRDVAALHVELMNVRADRDALAHELETTRAENVVLRKRVDDLEAITKGNV